MVIVQLVEIAIIGPAIRRSVRTPARLLRCSPCPHRNISTFRLQPVSALQQIQHLVVVWQDRYPEYRRDLADVYMTWVVQSIQAEYPGPGRYRRKQACRPDGELCDRHCQTPGRSGAKGAVGSVTPFDELVLTAVYLLRGQGDDMAIIDKLSAMQGQEAQSRRGIRIVEPASA